MSFAMETPKKTVPPLSAYFVKSNTALKSTEPWMWNMSEAAGDETTNADIESRPPRLGGSTRVPRHSKVGPSDDHVSRKLYAKLEAEKRDLLDDDEDDEDLESRTILNEGHSINRPPMFNGEAYTYWKARMKIFIESYDKNIWKSIKNGYTPPTTTLNGKTVEKDEKEWSEDEIKNDQYNLKAKQIITTTLGYDEFSIVSNCETAKEMWDALEVTYEGITQGKWSRKNTLLQEYELFQMQQGEKIMEVQLRFQHIVNHLRALGEKFDENDLVHKVLRSLSKDCQPIVTVIKEVNNLNSMTVATLFGKLQAHEMELKRFKGEKGSKKKGIALKSSSSIQEDEDDDDIVINVNDPEVAFILKRLGKLLRKGSYHRNKKKESSNIKKNINKKPQRVYNEVRLVSSDDEDEMTYLCLTAHTEEEDKNENRCKRVNLWS